MVTANFENLKISSYFTGNKKMESQGVVNWFHHYIYVRNTETGQRSKFNFWGTLTAPDIYDKDGLLRAFEHIIFDAVASNLDYKEFCDEFGYDCADKTSKRKYNDCRKTANRLERVYGKSVDELQSNFLS